MSLILSGTDGVADVDGSAASPAIRGTDPNTGIFFPAADTVAISEGGVESVRFDSSGNALFGTTTNTNGSRIVSNGVIESTTGGVRFPDGSTQTTAAGAVTTTAVLNATAGGAFGAVGTYCSVIGTNGVAVPLGGTIAGSNLNFINSVGNLITAVSGTWRNMGCRADGANSNAQTYLRIS
jgi:hypothetical protein